MGIQGGAVLHGLFTLADGVSEQEFFPAFDAFYQHLREMGFVHGCRMMRCQPLEGFGAPLPSFDYHIEIEFASLEKDQACYDYVKENKAAGSLATSSDEFESETWIGPLFPWSLYLNYPHTADELSRRKTFQRLANTINPVKGQVLTPRPAVMTRGGPLPGGTPDVERTSPEDRV